MIFLDHAIIFVRNLESAAHQYRRLGFTLAQRGGHPSLGTANHTIMLGRDYLELLTVLDRSTGSERWAQILDHREGFGAMALGTNDARSTRATLIERGIAVPPVIDFERPVALLEGEVRARFTVAHLPPDASPALPAFFCQQHTREFVWRPEWQHHANTAFGIAGMTVVHPAPDLAALAYQRLLGTARVHPHPGGVAIDLGAARLWLVSPDYAAARLGPRPAPPDSIEPVGLSLLVHDLGTATSHLRQAGVAFRPFGPRSIIIHPDWSSGVHLELLAAEPRLSP